MRSVPVTWRQVVGYEGLYEVSSKGEVRGCPKEVSGNHLKSIRHIPARAKRQCLLAGYPAVTLFRDGKPKLHKVHRLVAEAFIPNEENFPMVNHIDNDKRNNDVSNLEWCTALHNNQHMMKQGRQNFAYGERSSTCKLTEDQVVEILSLSGSMKQCDIAKQYGIGQQQVSRILNGERWKHLNRAGVQASKDRAECEVCQ